MPQKIFGKTTKIYTLSNVKVYNALISLVNSSAMIYTELGPGIGPKILTARGDAALGFHKSLPGQLKAAHQRGAMSCVMARLKNEKELAEYIGLEVATFRAWVESGRLPQPIPDCGKYDAKALDLALDRISGINSPTNALDAWRVTKGAKNAGAA